MSEVNIRFSSEEALVLLEWLSRVDPAGNPRNIAHPSEQRILWDLEAILERQISQPFSHEYKVLLEKARKTVADDI